MGPGTTTSVMQVAADALGLPAREVTFRLGDSTYPLAPPHVGATTMASVGSAAHTSCRALRNKFIGMAVADPASPLYRAVPATVAVRDGRLGAGGNGAADSYREILRRVGAGRHGPEDLQLRLRRRLRRGVGRSAPRARPDPPDVRNWTPRSSTPGTPWRIPSGSRGWGRSPSWESRRPSVTQCSTPPANV
ncbi:molybdopterin cofactor-binding domain-containing protein [Streptomyces sp. NPDC048550]|uniref:molybdopterin cofactor-binding domain-containing protein n=1 Tax=Streptomyces sp. NPDC048550 TaxID=3155739 RepID=UPI003431A69D